MKNHILAALGMMLLMAGLTPAQEPEPIPAPKPEAGSPTPAPAPAPADAPAPLPRIPGSCEGDCARPKEQLWVTAEYVLAWFHGDNLPPLVTTSPAGTPQAVAGVLGHSPTSVLFGDSRVNDEVRSGLRFGVGCWFDAQQTLGIEAGTMIMESQSTLFSASSTGTPILAQPFFNAATNAQDAILVAFPGSTSGTIDVRASSGNFYEAHIDLSENVLEASWVRVDALLGYRFYRYDEGLSIRQVRTPTNPLFVPGTQIATDDEFTAENEFHGGDFGARAKFYWGDLVMGLSARLAVGGLSRGVKIDGSTVTTVPGVAPVVQTGGLYALSTNIGTHNNSDWVVMPEFGADLGWQVTSNLRVRVGYTLFALDRIARAADQLDFTVNSNLIPPVGPSPAGPNRPAFTLNRSDVWVQTLNLGVEFTY